MYVKTNRVVGRMGKVTSLRRFDVRFLVARANNRNRVNTKKNRVRLLRNFRTKRRTHDGFRYTEKCYSFANPITVFFFSFKRSNNGILRSIYIYKNENALKRV